MNPIRQLLDIRRRNHLAASFLERLKQVRPSGLQIDTKDGDVANAVLHLVEKNPEVAVINTEGGLTLQFREDADSLVNQLTAKFGPSQTAILAGGRVGGAAMFLNRENVGGLIRG